MRNFVAKIAAFVKDEDGLTMVEYAVAGAMITAAAVTAFELLGAAVEGQINELTGFINNGSGGTAP